MDAHLDFFTNEFSIACRAVLLTKPVHEPDGLCHMQGVHKFVDFGRENVCFDVGHLVEVLHCGHLGQIRGFVPGDKVKLS